MKIKKEVTVDFSSVYCGWNCLEITDVDGTKVEIKLNDEQWLKVSERVSEKADSINKKRKEAMQDSIDAAVQNEVERLESKRKEIQFDE